MTKVSVRAANRSDAKLIARVIVEIELFYGSTNAGPLAEQVRRVEHALFNDPPLAFALIAVDESGEISGIAAYSFLWPATGATHSIFLKELYVRQGYRRSSIGAALMNELCTMALADPGCSRLEWMADRADDSARSFYRSLGVPEFEEKVVYRLNDELLRAIPERRCL